jgi:hypothetical protein
MPQVQPMTYRLWIWQKKTNVVCSAGKDTEYLLKLWFYGDLNLSAWIYNYVKHLTVLLVMIPRLKFDSIQFMTLTTLKIRLLTIYATIS